MFRVAMREENIERVPHIPMLKETNVRTGFVDYAAFQRLQAATEREELWLRFFWSWALPTAGVEEKCLA